MSKLDVAPIVVVGAGLAGLRTADLLASAGRSVLVVEAAPRIGGRLLRQSVAGVDVDAGGAWVGPGQEAVLALVDELGLERVPTYDRGKTVLELRGRRRQRSGWIPPAPSRDLFDLAQASAQLEWWARRLPRRCDQFDAVSFGVWLDRRVHTAGARTLLTLAVGAVAGSQADEVSLLAVLRDIQHAGGLLRLTGTRGGAQDSRIRGGSVTLCERLAARIGPARQRLGSPVVAVTQHDDGATVHLGSGEVIAASRVVVATDPLMSGRIDFGAGLPPARKVLHHDFKQGSGIKFHLAYRTPFWRTRGLSGQVLADSGLARLTFDATPDPNGPGVLVGFLGDLGGLPATAAGDEAAWGLWALMEPDREIERRDRVVHDLVRLLGPEAATPIDYVEQDWRCEQYLSGCVPAPDVGVLTRVGSAPLTPHGRVHWAGTDTSHTWPGYMDGAVSSARRVVTELV